VTSALPVTNECSADKLKDLQGFMNPSHRLDLTRGCKFRIKELFFLTKKGSIIQKAW